MNDEKKLKQIVEAFSQNLNIQVDEEKIRKYLNSAKKKGQTNTFTEDFEIDKKKYLIRINGKLWPPYERKNEDELLNTLKKNNIKTNVLFNGDGFQICAVMDEQGSLAAYIKKQNKENIERVLALVAKEIVKYQKLEASKILHPVDSMLENVSKTFSSKLKNNPETVKTANSFVDTCRTIIEFNM
jgi:hypothetical protein